MRYFIAFCLVLVANVSQAWVDFDGSKTPVAHHEWQEYDSEVLPSKAQIEAGLDPLKWVPLGEGQYKESYHAKLMRIKVRIDYDGPQRPILIVPYGFIPNTTVGLIGNGQLLMWESLNDESVDGGEEKTTPLSMLPLKVSAPGEYQLLLVGTNVANTIVVQGIKLHLDEIFLLREYPMEVSIASAFIGALSTYLLFCLALIAYHYRPTFLYALIFLTGAFGSMLLREGVLFVVWPMDVGWWASHVLPLAMAMTHAGVMLYVWADTKGTGWQRLRCLLLVCGLVSLLLGFLSVIFPARTFIEMGVFVLAFSLLGVSAGLLLVVARALQGGARNIIFALCFGAFFIEVLVRTLLPLSGLSIVLPALLWYIAIDLVGTYIFAEYLLSLTGEYLKKETAKTAEVTRFDLVNRFSHELRTPLNAVIGLADLLKDSKEIDKVKNYAGMIHSAGYSLLGLVNDILDFSKLGSTESALEERPFRLDRTLTDVLSGFLPRILESRTYIESLVDPWLPVFLVGDELRLKQIIGNLVSNALKFSKENDVITLRIQEGQRKDDAIELCCSIADTGRGIPADKLASIFEPFTQVEIKDSSQLGGTGLGLAICKLLVEQMGGTISIESELGRGTTISFNIWLKVSPDEPDLAREFSPLAGKRILLISRMPTMIHQLQLPLEYWGAILTIVESCNQAPNETFDMVVADSRYSVSAADRPWLEKLPASTAIHILDLESFDWLHEINHPNVRILTVPQPMLTVLASLTEHLGGEPVQFIDRMEANEEVLQRVHRVLLVDDNSVNLMVGSKLLRSLDIECDTATGGRDALQKMESAISYSLVLLDCEMPDIDGFAVARQWRAHERERGLQHLPIVALTAHAINEVRESCLEAGMDEVMYKPIGRGALTQLMNRYPGLK